MRHQKNNIMRTLSKFLAFIVMVGVLASCGKGKDPNKEGGKCNNAALELYCKYADNDNLTVAYLGDFNMQGKKIDAVMLQASDDDEWQLLRQDFGLVVENDSCEQAIDFSACPESDKVVSVGVGIETVFLDVVGLDSSTTRDQITEEHIRLFSENVAMQLHSILNNFGSSDSLMPAATIVVGDGPIQYEGEKVSYDDYVKTVAETITKTIIESYFIQRNSIENIVDADTYQKSIEEADSMMTNAKMHGHSGYITAADHTNRTLWLFFYDDQQECNNILTHIREDIIIKE